MQKLVWKRFLHGPFYNVEIGFTSYPSNELSVISDSYIVRPLPRRKHLQSGGRSGRHGGRGSVRHLYVGRFTDRTDNVINFNFFVAGDILHAVVCIVHGRADQFGEAGI